MRKRACLLVAACLGAQQANAQSTLSYDTVSTHTGPVIGDSRQLGLGGAYVALAEGARGIAANPAAVAYRFPYDVTTLGWDLGIDISVAGLSRDTGRLSQDSELDVSRLEARSLTLGSLAASFQFAHAGIGFSAEARRQAMRPTATDAGFVPAALTGNFGVLHLIAGYGFGDGDLIIGIGPRIAGVSFNVAGGGQLLNVSGVGYELGVLYGPERYDFRAAIALRSQVQASTAGSTATDETVWSPERVSLPWEVSLGLVYQMGERPLNLHTQTVEQLVAPVEALLDRRQRSRTRQRRRIVRVKGINWSQRTSLLQGLDAERRQDEARYRQALIDARRELQTRYRALPRRYVLFASELLFVGSTQDSLEVGALLASQDGAAGDYEPVAVTVSPRLGMEAELLPSRLRLRTGGYLEPARVPALTSRVHGTWGADVKLFEWDVFGLLGEYTSWRLSAAADFAFGYRNTSIGLGFWH